MTLTPKWDAERLSKFTLDAHLHKFKDNMGAYSEEQGERFHQDVLNFERHCQGQ